MNNIQEKIDYILKMQAEINKYCNDKNIYTRINNLGKNKEYIRQLEQEILNEYPKKESEKYTGAVGCLRLLIIRKLLNNEEINKKTIQELKEKYINKTDVKFFDKYFANNKYSKIKNDIKKNNKDNPFQSWKEIDILRRLLKTKAEFEKSNQYLKDIGKFVISEIGLSNEHYKQDEGKFLNAKRYGTNIPTIIIYNKAFSNKTNAIQICLHFDNNCIETCIQSGVDDGYETKETISETSNSEILISDLKNSKQEFLDKTQKKIKGSNNMNKQPLNQILYGPPGTGKTYNTKNIISKIFKMKENFYNWFIDKSIANDKEKTFKDYLSSIIKINENFGINIFEIYDKKRFVNIKNLIKETDYYKNNYKHSETSQGTSYYDSALNQYEKFLNDTNYVKRVEFITFHQSYSYEEFVEGIRPVILRGDDWGKETDVKYKGEDGIFKQICNRAREDKENNYVLIIDEINRGNISKIFGELITLIEDDKRECVNGIEPEKYNTIKVRLPYSQNEFSVPNNLYIIGTMNTSDRSIASVDIALRRRFKFVEMMPDESKVANFGVQFESIFEKLNKKIEILLDRDHKIGHSYFIKDKYDKADSETLCEIWYDSIIPLLNEYFYNDWEKLELLIPGFIDKKDIDELKEYCSQDYYYSFIPKDDFYVEEVFDKTKFENALKQDVSEGK